MSRANTQYNFFKNICMDDNGLLCGIQDVVDGLQNITLIVSGNTDAINNIDINVQQINVEMVEVNSNIEELNGTVEEIKTCVCPATPIPPTPTPTPCPPPCPTPVPPPPSCHQPKMFQWGGYNIVRDRRA